VTLLALPPLDLLRAAPELAALVILDAALVTAEETLLAHHPAADLDGDLPGDAPPDGVLAAVLVARFDELHHLLGRYHLAVKSTRLAANDDFPF
jgi:hypothetical protein